MSKQIISKEEARSAIKRGIDQLANVVKVTLGPKGRNVIIEHEYGHQSTKDGVSVARAIELADPIESIGANIIKEVAANTVDSTGDGTTTAIVLAQSIYSDGIRNVAAGANPMELKKGIDAAVEKVVEFINSNAIPVKDNWELVEQVATVSANGDVATAKTIASTLKETGSDGLITLEHSKTPETHVKLVKGMELRQGMISPYFVNNTETMECVLEDCYILITDKEVSSLKDLMKTIQAIPKTQHPDKSVSMEKPLLVIAQDVDGESLGFLVTNKIKGNAPFCAIRAPGQADVRVAMLEDICCLTGGNLISESKGRTLDTVVIGDFGIADKVVITRSTTLIVGGKGEPLAISNRVAKIKSEIEGTENPGLKELHKLRLAKLTGKVGIIYVGGQSEVETKELKDRCDDALGATRAALDGGIVSGGGSTFIRALDALKDFKMQKDDENTGVDIIRNALKAPLRQILQNGGMEESGIFAQVMDSTGSFGFNARTEVIEDLMQSGIIDPAKCLITCLQNASSVSGLLLTTEAVISKSRKDEIKS